MPGVKDQCHTDVNWTNHKIREADGMLKCCHSIPLYTITLPSHTCTSCLRDSLIKFFLDIDRLKWDAG